MMKRFLGWFVLTGLVLALLSYGILQSVLKPDPSKPVYRFPEGAELALVENLATLDTVGIDDVADILDIKRWRFKFTSSKDVAIGYLLELRQPGKAPKEILKFASWGRVPEGQVGISEEILLALQPLGSSPSYFSSDKLQFFVRKTGSRGKGTHSGAIDNPLKGMRVHTESSIEVDEDGAFRLMSVGKNTNVYPPKEGFLTFRMKIGPPKSVGSPNFFD